MKKVKKTIQTTGNLREQLARVLADYDNLKKRSEREREEYYNLAKARVISNLLPVFDMFESVQAHVKDSGLAMALGELTKVLVEEGIVVIEPKEGDEFDELTMEAVEAIEKPEMAGKVASLSLKGYRMGEKIMRYAKVTVFKGKLALDSRE